MYICTALNDGLLIHKLNHEITNYQTDTMPSCKHLNKRCTIIA